MRITVQISVRNSALPIIAIFLCPNCLRRMATRGPLPRLRNTIIELVMAASVLPY
jgi:hypothetical protein